MKITAAIIAKNEEKNIERVIKSVSFCDEIIVVDDFSGDKTVEHAKSSGAFVYQRKLDGDFATQRNFSMEKAKGDWILFLDADEEVTPELKDEISKNIENKEIIAYYIKRRDNWWGRWLKFGELFWVYHFGLVRLVKKNSGHWQGKVHEKFVSAGPTSRLNNFLNHYPHPNVKSFISEVNAYSTLRARELYANGKKSSILAIVFYPFFKFITGYFLTFGFLDGPAGFTYAFLMSFHSFLVRSKLYQYCNLQEK